jgi:hypothetical protein
MPVARFATAFPEQHTVIGVMPERFEFPRSAIWRPAWRAKKTDPLLVLRAG